MLGPSVRSPDLICPLLTSAISSHRLSALLAQGKMADLPGYNALTFPLMPAASTIRLSVQISDFEDICLLIQPDRLICDFCSSSQRVLPAASSRFHLAVDTLADRLTIPPTGFVEDFHLQVSAPCRAHKRRRASSRCPSPYIVPGTPGRTRTCDPLLSLPLQVSLAPKRESL